MLRHCYKLNPLTTVDKQNIGDKGDCETDCKMSWLKVHARGTEAVWEHTSVFLQKIIDYGGKVAHRSFPGSPETQQLTC